LNVDAVPSELRRKGRLKMHRIYKFAAGLQTVVDGGGFVFLGEILVVEDAGDVGLKVLAKTEAGQVV